MKDNCGGKVAPYVPEMCTEKTRQRNNIYPVLAMKNAKVVAHSEILVASH